MTVAKLVMRTNELQNVSDTFMNQTCEQKIIGQASILAFQLLYGGSPATSLAKLRYKKFITMSGRGVINPESLPPTEQAAYYHGLRAFYQIMEWRFFDEDSINPQDWGWKKDGDTLIPIMTTHEYAPSYLQSVVSCTCKLTSKNPCSTNKCTCKKNGLPCLPSCSDCGGEDCHNISSNKTSTENSAEKEVEEAFDSQEANSSQLYNDFSF